MIYKLTELSAANCEAVEFSSCGGGVVNISLINEAGETDSYACISLTDLKTLVAFLSADDLESSR